MRKLTTIKLVIILITSTLITNCKPKEKEEGINIVVKNGSSYEYKMNIKYIKGKKTHLCFVRFDNGEVNPTAGILTCVPCDSLKNVKVEEIEGL